MSSTIQHTGFSATLGRELNRIKKGKVTLWLCIFLPLLTFGFFTYMFHEGVATDLPISIVNNDNSSLSRTLVRMIDETSSVHIVKHSTSTEEARQEIVSGDIYGVVVIPSDFSKKIYSGEAPQVLAYTNNAYILPGGIVNRDITVAVRTFAAGLNISTRIKKGESATKAMANVVPVKVDSHILFNPSTNYFYYLVIALLPAMLQLFVLMATVFAIGVELKEGTSQEWLATAGNSIGVALAGKLLPYFLMFSVVGFFMNTLLFSYFGVPVQGSRLLIEGGLLLMILGYIALGVAIISWVPSLRMALSMSSLYGALAFSFSGLTFPILAMPDGAQLLSNIWPYTHYLKILVEQAMRDGLLSVSLECYGKLLLFNVLPLLALIRLKKVCSNSKFWGLQ